MNDSLLADLAKRAGIEPSYRDTWGNDHQISEVTLRALLRAMGFATNTREEMEASLARLKARVKAELPLLETAARAWRPSALAGDGRRWGLSVQLYGLRTAHTWGIGDFSALAEMMRGAAALGACAIGVNPLHALFPARPEHASPYSPSSRRFFNPLYLDVKAMEDFADCSAAQGQVAGDHFQTRLHAAREAGRVQYSTVAELKWPILGMLYQHFRKQCLDSDEHPRGHAFRLFQSQQRRELRRFATFHVLAETQTEMDWRCWPAVLTDPDSKAVEVFAAQQVERIEFHEYLQWQAALQLERVNETARTCGMSIGLYADLAIGADPTGAECWSAQQFLVRGVTIGAPPDALNLSGQNWGLPPLHPLALREARYVPFVELLRANMQHAGALRIDHIPGLMRLYWVPAGASAAEGAYVRYPWHDLLGLLAVQSQRSHCLIIGEDLGTVPEGLREAMHDLDILSYRLLYFAQQSGKFCLPQEYPADALVAAGSHDLPPLPMWWNSEDIDLRERLGLWPDAQTRTAETQQRSDMRHRLTEALRDAGLFTAEGVPAEAPVEAVYACLARTPCKLLMVQFEDVLDQHAQVNVPGTTEQYPNWRQRLPCSVAEALAHPRMQRIAAMLNGNGRGDQ